MSETIIQDPVTVSFYVEGELFRSVTVERGADVQAPDGPEKADHLFLHWTRTAQGGQERTYTEGQWLFGVPFDVSLDAVFRNAAFQHEVSNVSHVVVPGQAPPPVGQNELILTWTSPTDVDFSHVRVYPSFLIISIESELGTNTVSIPIPYRIVRGTITIISVDIHGNMSRGIEYTAEWDNLDW